MILYHTSRLIVKKPEIAFSRNYLDFGRGFYTTPSRIQAERYAKRFFKEGQPAILNIYEWDDSFVDYTKKLFDAYDNDWLDYVVLCRTDDRHDTYDVIEGGIADDDVFNTLDLYISELIDKSEAIKRLKKKKPDWQICFCSQDYMDSHLHFIESVVLSESHP